MSLVYLESLSEYLYQNSLSLYELENKYNVKINHFPADLTKKMFKISREVVESFSDLGNIHRKFILVGKEHWANLISIKIFLIMDILRKAYIIMSINIDRIFFILNRIFLYCKPNF